MLSVVVFSALLTSGALAQIEVEPAQSINLEEYFKSEAPRIECQSTTPLKVIFSLYTRATPYVAEKLRIDDGGLSVRNSNYNVKKNTKFLIHGWLQSADIFHEMVLDYLYSKDVNVILVDWSEYAKHCNLKSTQDVVLPSVTKALVTLMKGLIAYGSTAQNDFHIVSFGVGVHIAAQSAKKLAPIKLNRITGLDPTGYKFNEPGRWKIQNSDALFVDLIYTSIPLVADDRDVGHVNFYPNGGRHPQPGCTDDMICSSLKSIQLWKKSILSSMSAWKCDSWDNYKGGGCKREVEVMGENLSRNARGKFFTDSASYYHDTMNLSRVVMEKDEKQKFHGDYLKI